jgi:hypothetical protein
MNTVAVTSALLVYACRGRYVAVPWIFFLLLLLCHTSYNIKCHHQLKIYHLQTPLQSAFNDTIGIAIKWITLAQHKTELFTLRTFRQLYLLLYAQGRETEERSFTEQQYVIWSERFQLEIFVTKQIALRKTWKEPQCEWPLSNPAASLKCFMICIVCNFRKTNGRNGIGLQRIIAYCGSRYLGCSCRLPL